MMSEQKSVEELGLILGFFKLTVDDLEAMIGFYRAAFGFQERERLDFPHLEEAMLVLPGQQFNLVLCSWKDGRETVMGNGFGPLGLVTRDVEGAYKHALSCGATSERAPVDVGANRISFVLDPEGHQIELIQFNAS
jgi:lactoylglutathione lyase